MMKKIFLILTLFLISGLLACNNSATTTVTESSLTSSETESTLTTTNSGNNHSDFEEYYNYDPINFTTDGDIISIGYLYINEYDDTPYQPSTQTTIPDNSSNADYTVYYELIKVTSSGSLIWYTNYLTYSFTVDFIHIEEMVNGNIIAIGTKSERIDNQNYHQPFLVEFNDKGEVLEEHAIEIYDVHIRDVVLTSDDFYILSGKIGSKAALIKINKFGETIWNNVYGNENGVFNILSEASSNNIIAAGFHYDNETQECSSLRSAYVIKVNSLGEVIWENTGKCDIVLESIQIVENDSTLISGIHYDPDERLSRLYSMEVSDDGLTIRDGLSERNDIVYQFDSENLYTIENKTSSNPILKKYNNNLELLWEIVFNNSNIMRFNTMIKDENGLTYLMFMTTKTKEGSPYDTLYTVITLYVVDEEGNILLNKQLGI